jgi:ribosomal protein S18 acetylase RimI-like enzyme
MSSEYFFPQYRMLALMKELEAGKPVASILADAYEKDGIADGTYVWTQVWPTQDDYLEKRQFFKALGMSYFQTKVVFELRAFDRTVAPDYRLSFETAEAIGDQALVEMVSECVSTSLDRDLSRGAREQGPRAVALEHVVNAASGGSFAFEKSWWQVGFCNGKAAGFVLPVKYDGCDKEGLIEGTFHIVGVRPEFRGRGFARELVTRGSQVLAEIGMWRIYNDADTDNVPMVRAFRSAGHKELGTIEKYGMHWHRQAT